MTPSSSFSPQTNRLGHRLTAVACIDLGPTSKSASGGLKQDVAMIVVAAGSAGEADPRAGKRQRDWRTSHAGKRRR